MYLIIPKSEIEPSKNETVASIKKYMFNNTKIRVKYLGTLDTLISKDIEMNKIAKGCVSAGNAPIPK